MDALIPLCLLLFVAITLYFVVSALRDVAKAIKERK